MHLNWDGNDVEPGFYNQELFADLVLKKNLRIEGMNNDEIIDYYHKEFPESLSTQNSNTISFI